VDRVTSSDTKMISGSFYMSLNTFHQRLCFCDIIWEGRTSLRPSEDGLYVMVAQSCASNGETT